MKSIFKFSTGIGFAFGPVVLTVWLLFFKLVPYIGSLIPAGEWHPLLAFLVGVVVALFGGIELVILSIMLGFFVAASIFD